MATRKEIEDQIAALQAEAEAMGEDDGDFEVEIWNDKGEGARLPHSRGQKWLAAKFPELFTEDPTESGDDSGNDPKTGKPKSPAGKTESGSTGPRASTATKYFGKRQAAK